jgi:hypothetical protein
MTQDDLDDMPGGERLNYERDLYEGMGSGSSFIVDEFIDLNGGIEELQAAYGGGEEAVDAQVDDEENGIQRLPNGGL